ncbi:MAG TPA: hypothetical protein VFA45_18885 [Actinomycetes bacterium]|jgi:uracil-DNA glycosylase|nr:hypothetical protein [Actinomycetes bacterium]
MADGGYQRLRARLREAPSPYAVPDSLPVLFFGDLFSAEIATVGLNPSDQEYTNRRGDLLAGSQQRFATLSLLGASERSSLTDEQCDEAISWMRGYFQPGRPVYGWFVALARVVGGLGASFADATAAHLDLVQEPTHPTWSALPAEERKRLLEQDLPFLEWQIRSFPLRAVICTGKTVSGHVRRHLNVTVEETDWLARIKWWTGSALIDGRSVGFAGWNYPLARPTGLGAEGERRLGVLLRQGLGL